MTAPPSPQGWGPPAAPATPEERNWALASHLGCVVGAWIALAFLVPLVIMLIKKDSAYVRRHAVESLNFQISMLIYGFIAVLLIFVGIGLVLLPVLGVLWLVFVVLATLKASNGLDYRYPLTIRFVS